ncbi:ketoacyl-ACP synthase III family protein [Dactylosporangium sp. NPDC051541]|uniref:ketoacyl-ACP synthase III family protein n=1 Tax=Dactylosporangium sp. NPDC051541 TaxID=3363977 RepID=UPI0037BC6A2E
MRTPDVFIKGIGLFVPPVVDVDSAVEQGLVSAEKAATLTGAGAAVAGDTPAPEMALTAARQALERAGHEPSEVDLMLYSGSWHQGPDGWLPHSYLQHHLVGGKTPSMAVNQGCNSTFGALELAHAYLGAAPERRTALLVASDNFGTPLVDRWNCSPGAFLGDGASAIVVSRDEGFARVLAMASTTVAEAEELHRAGEPLFPPGVTTATPIDFGVRGGAFQRQLITSGVGVAVWLEVQKQMAAVIGQVTDEAGVKIDDVARISFTVLAGEMFEQPCLAAVGMTPEQSTSRFSRGLGHLGSSDQFVAFEHLLSTGELKPGDHMLLHGMGPGITLSCALVRVESIPPWLS